MLVSAVPVLHALNVNDTVEFYEKQLGFTKRYQQEGGAILSRDAVEIHFTYHDDRYLAEHTSCRIKVTDVESLYEELKPKGVVHPHGDLHYTSWGTQEFGIIDINGNAITFYQNVRR